MGQYVYPSIIITEWGLTTGPPLLLFAIKCNFKESWDLREHTVSFAGNGLGCFATCKCVFKYLV